MKVYELMSALAEMPSGANVRISMLKSLDEMPEHDDGLRRIDFELQDITDDGEVIWLDG
ncbi:MAG: hypothetical protein ACOYJD_09735 [Christensenellales bacterium]